MKAKKIAHKTTAKAKHIAISLCLASVLASANTQFWAKGVTQTSGWGPSLFQNYGQNYCWAYTAAALLDHWQQNAQALSTTGIPTGRQNIVDYLKNTFPQNQGREVALGLRNFFYIYYPNIDYDVKVHTKKYTDYKGSHLAFSNEIQAILQMGSPVGISYLTTGAAHAITIWGAEFDENGEMTIMYATDSANANNELGIYTKNGEQIIVQERDDAAGISVSTPKNTSKIPTNVYIVDYLANYTGADMHINTETDGGGTDSGGGSGGADGGGNQGGSSGSGTDSGADGGNSGSGGNQGGNSGTDGGSADSGNQGGTLIIIQVPSGYHKAAFESALVGALSVSSTHGALSQMLGSLNAQNLVAAGFERSQMKNSTGSWVKSTNSALNAAFAGVLGENALVGAFVEAGLGAYDTHNDLTNAVVKGDGETKFIGGGVFVRFLGDAWHFDAAARGGQVLSSYNATTSMGYEAQNVIANMDLKRFYYGFLGIAGLNLGSKFEVFARASYTNLQKSEVNLGQNRLEIDSIHSLIGVAGLKFTQNFGTNFKAYASVGAEREFLGDARGRSVFEGGGYALGDFKAPSMRGNSFVGELGFGYDGAFSSARKGGNADKGGAAVGKNGVSKGSTAKNGGQSGFFANFKAQVKSGQNSGFGGGLDLGWRF